MISIFQKTFFQIVKYFKDLNFLSIIFFLTFCWFCAIMALAGLNDKLLTKWFIQCVCVCVCFIQQIYYKMAVFTLIIWWN